MPITVTKKQGGAAYADIRVGEGHGIHQMKLNRASLAASVDAEGYLPPGFPLSDTGGAVGAGQTHAVIGPEAVKLGAADHFANTIFTGVLNKAQIEENLGRALTAAEKTVPAALRLI